MDFDGLKQRIVEMLGGARIKIEVGSFQNDMTTFHCADDVLTLLIHLGYLAYDSKTEKAFIPNEEVRSAFVLAIRNRGWDEVYMSQTHSAQRRWNGETRKFSPWSISFPRSSRSVSDRKSVV